MRKLYLQCGKCLEKAVLLMAMLMVSFGALASDIQPLTLDKEYTVGAIQTPVYSFTPSENCTIYLYSSSNDFPELWKDSECTDPYNLERNPYSNPRWQYKVTKGTTYYVGFGLNAPWDALTFYITTKGPDGIKATNVEPEEGDVISVGIPISMTFDMPVSIESATLQGGTAEPVALGVNVYSANASFEVKDILYGWMKEGKLKAGDEVKLTLTGVQASANPDLKGGDNGTMVLTWKSAPMPISLVSQSIPAKIREKWEKDDPNGIAVLEFSGDVAEGVIATVENGDVEVKVNIYNLPVTVEGNKVIIDFTDKFFIKVNDEPFVFSVMNVNDKAGYPAYSPGAGKVGSFSFDMIYDNSPYVAPVKYTFTPAANADIKDVSNISVKVENVTSDYSYSGASFSYFEKGTKKTLNVAKSEIEITNNGTDITLGIKVPAGVANADEGSNVILTLLNGTSTLANVVYMYGEAREPEKLEITLVSPANGSTLAKIGADESIDLNITGLPEGFDFEVDGTIVDNETEEVVKNCFFMPVEEESGYNYSSTMYSDVDLFKGHTYTLTINVNAYELDEYGFRGAPQIIGTAKFTYKGDGTPFVYSDIQLIGLNPNPVTESIASVDDNVVTVTFNGDVSEIRVVEPLGMGMGVTEYEVEKANATGSKWKFTIPAGTIKNAKGTFTINMYAFDKEGHPVWKSGLWDSATWSGVPDAEQAKDETYFSITYKCTVGSPDFTITPENGSIVENIDKFVLSYSQGINYSWLVSSPIVLYKGEGEDGVEIQTWEGSYFDMLEHPERCERNGENIAAWTLKLDKVITEDGVYTLVVPEGFFFLGSEFDQANSKRQIAVITVDQTVGVDELDADSDADGMIFNIFGVKVSDNYKGIVIKNGKKFYVK